MTPVELNGSRWDHRLRVVVADDHPFYRRSLAAHLRESGIEVVREVANGEAAIRAAFETTPDVVVMDLNMPGMSGLEATRRLTDATPLARVLILTVSAQEDDVADAMLMGASAYVLKDGPVEDVVAGIRAAASGEARISPGIAAVLLRHAETDEGLGPGAGVPRLSARELAVLRLLADGRQDAEIEESLGLPPGAVRDHVGGILMKLQIESRVWTAIRAIHQRDAP